MNDTLVDKIKKIWYTVKNVENFTYISRLFVVNLTKKGYSIKERISNA